MRRIVWAIALGSLISVLVAGTAYACGGLVAPNGTISLLRTATLAAYHDGVEHYITSFKFEGTGAEFGSIVPLPGIPSDVVRGGDWTLQRLLREVNPPERRIAQFNAVAAEAASGASVIMTAKVDALDITVLKGGGDEVGAWATEHGFLLPPDAPEILDFYGDRSPVFMTVKFNAARAAERGRNLGDSIPVHVTIPTPNPWVPLRILTLGLQPDELVQADVFLLTDAAPALLPRPRSQGFVLEHSAPATGELLTDLRSDRGMEWLPADGMHLSYLKIDAPARELRHDLAVDPTGLGAPSFVAAGLVSPSPPFIAPDPISWTRLLALSAGALILVQGFRRLAA
ncbi:MAG TPA: DUF2330 domain-containing protein [Actinomycetota bacterium]|nr:DUF2330 domain-containing protein [Actinomycetota bacterium]